MSSLKGDVAVLAANASPDRVSGRVELDAALKNEAITSLGGVSTDTLRAEVASAHGDLSGVLQHVQERFRAEAARGAFRGADNELVLSREFADAYRLKGDFPPAAELEAQGLRRVMDPGTLSRGLEHGNLALNAALLGYDAVKVSQQYATLEKSGNVFAASTLVRDEALTTGAGLGGAILGSAAAGLAWGAAGGAETGPGALVTGAVGGVVGGVAGAIGSSELSRRMTENRIDHETGSDGKTYHLKGDTWQEECFLRADVPAPVAQVPVLEMRRTEKINDLAIAHPPHPDPSRIDVVDSRTHATQTWERGDGHGWQSHVRSGWSSVTVAASPELASTLNAISAERALVVAHGPEMAANAYVMDYYGKGWDKIGPLPQSVIETLKLPSETKIVDAATGKTWDVAGDAATRSEFRPAGRGGYEATITASGGELGRVLAIRDRAVAENHRYGAELVERGFERMQQHGGVERPTPDRDAALADQASRPRHPAKGLEPVEGVDRSAVQSRVDALRSRGVSLPDVRSLAAHHGGTQTGSFVVVSDSHVAQHTGRGAYQVYDIARDLHGVTPPEGRPVTVDRRGQVAEQPSLGLSRH